MGRFIAAVTFVVVAVALSGCGAQSAAPPPADVQAAVQVQVQATVAAMVVPTATFAPTAAPTATSAFAYITDPWIRGQVEHEATSEALGTPSPGPLPTPTGLELISAALDAAPIRGKLIGINASNSAKEWDVKIDAEIEPGVRGPMMVASATEDYRQLCKAVYGLGLPMYEVKYTYPYEITDNLGNPVYHMTGILNLNTGIARRTNWDGISADMLYRMSYQAGPWPY